jgi:hypothetical protein
MSSGCLRFRRTLTLVFVAGFLLLTPLTAAAQGTSTISGRVVDESLSALPGATVTITNISTGVARTSTTNDEGAYAMPGLEPGVYKVTAELPGFEPMHRDRVTLIVNMTLTVDFKMQIGALQESITVTGEVPMVEVTQSKVANTIQSTELASLPMITRSMSGMLALLPGATVSAPLHKSKNDIGTVAFSGSSGVSVSPTVDGGENRDAQYGGSLMTFTTESIEQFQLSTGQFTAADGRSAGASLTIVTKSGTNAFKGSAFVFARDKAMTAKDFFTERDGLEKPDFKRHQFGGSLGGPIVRNRMFFFAAVERANQDNFVAVPNELYDEKELLVPLGLANPNHPRSGAKPERTTLYSIKSNAQLTKNHAIMVRYASMHNDQRATTFTEVNDMRDWENLDQIARSTVGQFSSVLGNTGLNQLTMQVRHFKRHADVYSITLENGNKGYASNFPNVPLLPPTLQFPSVQAGIGPDGGTASDYYTYQIKNDVSLLAGNHALRFGANYSSMGKLGIVIADKHFPVLTFFHDPSVILRNSNGLYPQGFQTPGIVRTWSQGTPVLGDARAHGAAQAMAWFQDDWRVTPKLTLNLGVRYDLDFNLLDQKYYENNATRLVLAAIENPYGGVPEASKLNFSPRVGFAFARESGAVLKGGWGLYFDQYPIGGNSDIMFQNKRPIGAAATLTNTAIGVGQLANFRFGIDPLPSPPAGLDALPRNAVGQWLDPDLSDPYNHQFHLGYVQELGLNTIVAVDWTHIEGRNDYGRRNINPIVNGVRALAPDFLRVFGVTNTLSATNILASENKSRYSGVTVQFQRRHPRATIQAHYTLSGAYAYGGVIGGRGGAPLPQDAFEPFADGEWGPTTTNETHRGVIMSVIELPWGVQLSPVFQAASGRPYTLTAGRDLNADGQNNDRYVDLTTGKQVSVNSEKGDPTVLFDMRATKFFDIGRNRLGVFVEGFNLFNAANHGNAFNGTATSALFMQPTGFIPNLGYPRQLQVGGRFLF